MPAPYRILAASTAAVLAGSVIAAGTATAGTGTSAPIAEHVAASAVHRDAPGQDPTTLNGHGLYKVRLANTADGRILVSWKWKKSATKRLKKWKVVTSTSRNTNTDVKTYSVKAKKRAAVVAHAATVTPASGDYTFVKVYSIPKHGKKHGSTTHWIQAPVTVTPTSAARVVIGTFNIRNADLDKSGAYTWSNRKQKVIANITSSGAGIVNLQEASGNATDARGAYLSQLDDVANGTGLSLVHSDTTYFTGRDGGGSQGTRILYDARRYSMAKPGYLALTGGRFIEYAEFTDLSTRKTFWDVSMHLLSGTSAANESTRVVQANEIIAKVRELHASDGAPVFLAGDSNSTIYSKPKGLVHRAFIGAGFYDAFATTSITNQAYPTTSDFDFPVKPSPHRRDVILSYGGPLGSFDYKNMFYNSAGQAASDHFMQVAELPLG